MKNPYKKFRIGNGLRGNITFKARSIKEAWKRGCKMFNDWCPSEFSKDGRSVYLEMEDDTRVTLTTKWYLEQNKLPLSKRYYSNYKEYETRGWVLVAYGMSKEELVFPKS